MKPGYVYKTSETDRERAKAWRAAHPEYSKTYRASRSDEVFHAYQKKWNVKNKHNHHKYLIFKTYGITSEEYDALLQQQNGCCALCEKPPTGRFKKLGVDHDHDTGRIRGLLCMRCNIALDKGLEYYQKVIAYLQKEQNV